MLLRRAYKQLAADAFTILISARSPNQVLASAGDGEFR